MKRNRGRAVTVRDRALKKYYDRTSSLEKQGEPEAVAMSFPKPRRIVALRLDEATVAAIRRLAEEKGLNYSTLMRMWITERLRQERGGSLPSMGAGSK